LLDIAQANTMAGMNFVSEFTADGGFLSHGRGALRAISYLGPGDEGAAFPIHPHMLRHACFMPWRKPATIRARFRPGLGKEYRTYVRCPELAPERFKDLAAEASCDGLEYGLSRNSNVIRRGKQTFEASRTVRTTERAS